MTVRKLGLLTATLLGLVVMSAAAVAGLLLHKGERPVAKIAAPETPLWAARVSDPEPGPLGKGSLHGRVVDAEGRPVAGAGIWRDTYDPKAHSWKTTAECRTDREGRFRLGPVEPVYRHRFDVVVEADGFARSYIPAGFVSIFPAQDYDLGTINLDRGRVFTGQVIDVDGKPRPNVDVALAVFRQSQGHGSTFIVPPLKLKTDSEGRFRTPPLPVGHFAINVALPERRRADVWGPVQPGGEQDLGVLQLEKDVPVVGTIKDEEGRPIAEVGIRGFGCQAITDASGKFTLRGFGPNSKFDLKTRKEGYAPVLGVVRVTEAGIHYDITSGVGKASVTGEELTVTMKRAGLIEGRAVDAETGKPISLKDVVVCQFERKPNGEVVLRPCRSVLEHTEQRGQFRASFPVPDEYHLTFSANGYHDAEAFIPRQTELKTVSGIIAKLKQKDGGSTRTVGRQTITGTVTRDGRPVARGWVGLWTIRKPANAVNTPMMRGRTVVAPSHGEAYAPIYKGTFTLNVPFPGTAWYIVAEEAGFPLTQVGPIPIALNEKKTVGIACTRGGRISGRVKNIPRGWDGRLWVVAFTKTAIQSETRVGRDGTFSFPELSPGEYGLKVGHDVFEDAEVYPGTRFPSAPAEAPREAIQQTPDPWKRAKVINVEADRAAENVELELPQ